MQYILQNIFSSIIKNKILTSIFLVPFYVFRFVFFALKEGSFLVFRYYPGYHGSTLPSLKYIKMNQDFIFKSDSENADGIDLNLDAQLNLLKEFFSYYDDFNPAEHESFKQRYYYKNKMFGFSDALILQAFLRHFKPSKIIEIGSGFSSGLMLDVCEKHSIKTSLKFIDPYSSILIA